MKYRINYYVLCHKGNVRSVNQDNFWCSNRYLDSINNGLSEPISGTVLSHQFPVFAVFDGMGGEEKGEIASYIASNIFEDYYSSHNIAKEDDFLASACKTINSAICDFAIENNIKVMGTTGAFVLFGKSDVFICNIGDSPIFRLDDNKLTQISTDHVLCNFVNGKPPLTQFLGVPESEFVIQPFIAKGAYASGDKYLICSDGLTDMVGLDEIEKILLTSNTIETAANKLLERALENGGKDNITIIICELCKEKLITVFKKGI